MTFTNSFGAALVHEVQADRFSGERMTSGRQLIYIHDPMCSWCWGFRPVFTQLLELLPENTAVRYVMGGLAPDNDQPMSAATRVYIQKMWHAVEKRTNANFNHDFWTLCQPRRSTYPACRSVIAAGLQRTEAIPEMIYTVQKAYYLQARNPSDLDVLVSLAGEIGLDTQRFKNDIVSHQVEMLLQRDFDTRRQLGVMSFPSVMLASAGSTYCLSNGYSPIQTMTDNLPDDLQ
jgi:putative protein-disulfide isomerase